MYGHAHHTTSARAKHLIGALLATLALIALTTVTGAAPASAAVPTASTTGVPSGTALKKHYGDLVIKTSGAVISGLDIYGNVTVKAANVTITKSRIRGSKATAATDLVRVADSVATGFKITDSTVAPDTPSVYHRTGIRLAVKGAVAQRVNVSGTVDGIRIAASTVRVESSFLSGFKHYTSDPFAGGKPSHDDAIQIEGGSGIVLNANNIAGARNAGVFVGQNTSSITNLTMTNNQVAYGGCSVNVVKNQMPYMTGMKMNYNKFVRNSRVTNCPVVYKTNESDLRPVGNTWVDTGQAIPLP